MGFLKLPRFMTYVLGIFLLVVSLGLAVIYIGKPHATLRITTGIEGGIVSRFISAFVAGTHAAHPRIDFTTVVVPDLVASSKALEEGRVDIALVRTDISPPNNGQTLIIVRRDIVAVVLPPGASIDEAGKLAGKTIAIPAGPLQEHNSRLLDLILSYYNVDANAVKRLYLPINEIGPALQHRKAAAALAVGPVGPGDAVAAAAVAVPAAIRPAVDRGDARGVDVGAGGGPAAAATDAGAGDAAAATGEAAPGAAVAGSRGASAVAAAIPASAAIDDSQRRASSGAIASTSASGGTASRAPAIGRGGRPTKPRGFARHSANADCASVAPGGRSARASVSSVSPRAASSASGRAGGAIGIAGGVPASARGAPSTAGPGVRVARVSSAADRVPNATAGSPSAFASTGAPLRAIGSIPRTLTRSAGSGESSRIR